MMLPASTKAVQVLLFAWTTTIIITIVGAQRLKEGCYDAGQMSCSNPRRIDEARLLGLDIHEICFQMELETFLTFDVAWDSSLHSEYLNGVESDSELCALYQIVYSQCVFCADIEDIIKECDTNAVFVQCGDQPSLEEVLQDNTQYAEFQTQVDIDIACEALEVAYNTEDGYLRSFELCDKQKLVKHLCPGHCDGGCFDAEFYPPTCDPDAFQGEYNDTLNAIDVCSSIRREAFTFVERRRDIVMNISNHLDFLQTFTEDDENSTICSEVRQAYSDCSWCFVGNTCFDDLNPPSCTAPGSSSENMTGLDLEGIEEEDLCMTLHDSFFDIDYPVDLYNHSIHANHLLVQANTSTCDLAMEAYHTCYWCVPEDVPIEFCENGSECNANITIPDDHISSTLLALNISHSDAEIYCDEIFDHWNETWDFKFSLRGCYDDIFLARLCPELFCPEAAAALEIDQNYLGATTTAQKRALIWMSRVAAILTFCGAIYILYDIFSDKKKLSTVYHRLLIGMAVFDIITAVAWSFATAPIDKAEAPHVEGAIGNESTCIAQAFFIQLGFTSVFYNVSLALYYALVVALGWRESQLKTIQGYLLLLPPIVGLGLAFGGITSYHWLEYGCHLLPPPDGDLWAVLVFVVLPLGFSIAAITAAMFVVYCKVRRQAATTRKWSFGVGKASALEQQVFWQALFYVSAFYITWPILFSVYLASVDVDGPLGLTLTVAFVAPLQGFTNFLVYLRPKLKKRSRSGSSGTSKFLFLKSTLRGLKNGSSGLDGSSKTDRLRSAALFGSSNNNDMDPSARLAQIMDESKGEEELHERHNPQQLVAMVQDEGAPKSTRMLDVSVDIPFDDDSGLEFQGETTSDDDDAHEVNATGESSIGNFSIPESAKGSVDGHTKGDQVVISMEEEASSHDTSSSRSSLRSDSSSSNSGNSGNDQDATLEDMVSAWSEKRKEEEEEEANDATSIADTAPIYYQHPDRVKSEQNKWSQYLVGNDSTVDC